MSYKKWRAELLINIKDSYGLEFNDLFNDEEELKYFHKNGYTIEDVCEHFERKLDLENIREGLK